MPDSSDDIDASIYSGKAPAGSNEESLPDRQPDYEPHISGRRGKPHRRTCESLRLNLVDAMEGKTWLLLPDGFRDRESGHTYPLPTTRAELQRLVVIPLPNRQDSGCAYIRRAIAEFRKRNTRRISAVNDASRKEAKIENAQREFSRTAKALKAEMREIAAGVQVEADKAIASLNDLFALGREGIEGQMRAHIAGEMWKGEPVNGRAFRECFRMVSQAVKGLGLPSDQREKARDTVMEEFAKSLEATRSAISGSTDDDSVPH